MTVRSMSSATETTAERHDTPTCGKHGGMAVKTPRTKEQAFCGTWYICEHTAWGHACGYTTLLPSLELLAQLDEQRANLAKGTKR
jgi:hypothetical protein